MNRVGFFREMAIAGDEYPSLREAVGSIDQENKDLIVAYLRAGHGVVIAPTMVPDALDPTREAVAGLGIVTDGEWLWPAELEYYVAEYDLGLPEVFVAHMRSSGWSVPVLTIEQLTTIAGEVAPGD